MSELLKQYIITKRESVRKTEVKKEPNLPGTLSPAKTHL